MTSGNPGRTTPAGSSQRSAPVALLSLSALEANVAAALANAPGEIVDVRADAWGHGAALVAAAALRAGAGAVLADPATAASLAGEIDPARVVTSGEPVDAEAVLGLSGHGASVLSLRGWVLSLKALRAGEGVSYGYTHRAARDTTVALVTGGYAQGIVRALGNRAEVAIAGRRHPIVGRVAMDVCVVDVGGADVARGDEVTFFGGDGAPEIGEWAAATGMSAGELVTAVGRRAGRENVA